ncbi:MAG: hypothetical protein DHS20C17_10590 [Cyclobacteriaceae bacterium]|nr:MAG: hypothetical protein DHS20C17_10590 [Cyclobacteriaceae bacterium]
MINLILPVVFHLFAGLLHPFHISVCEIEHDEEDQSLQITSRIFQDDFETALKSTGEKDGFFSNTEKSETNHVLKKFFNEHLRLIIDSSPVTARFIGFEIEENVIWCYLEVEKVDKLSEIQLTYTVLIDTFNDQINLAHIKYHDQVKSLKFQLGQLTGTAAFAN